METLTYKKENIEQLLNIINNIGFVGFDNANKISMVYQILNNPIKNPIQENENKLINQD